MVKCVWEEVTGQYCSTCPLNINEYITHCADIETIQDIKNLIKDLEDMLDTLEKF